MLDCPTGTGASGKAIPRATVKIDYMEAEIIARIDVPPGLSRRDRRNVKRWSGKIFRGLDPDPRPMRLVVTSGGAVVAQGFEFAGVCGVAWP